MKRSADLRRQGAAQPERRAPEAPQLEAARGGEGTVLAIIEVPRGSFVKRELHEGERIDFVSPLPSPFNYGFLPDAPGEDGDPADAVVLGPRLAAGTEVELTVVGRVRFVDAGAPDHKLVLSAQPISARQRLGLVAFFTLYARAKRALNLLRGARGATRFDGLEEGSALDYSTE